MPAIATEEKDYTIAERFPPIGRKL